MQTFIFGLLANYELCSGSGLYQFVVSVKLNNTKETSQSSLTCNPNRQSGFPQSRTESTSIPGQKVHLLHNRIPVCLWYNWFIKYLLLCFSGWMLGLFHPAFVTPTVDLELLQQSAAEGNEKEICQYLLIIHLSSEHLWGHPVGGADNSQGLLVFFLTAEQSRGKKKKKAVEKLGVKPTLLWKYI